MTARNKLYRSKILTELYFANTISCAELCRLINKSLPLTTKMLNELISEGLVVEMGFAPSSGGRRPATYSLKPGNQFIVSVALDQFVARIVIMDMQNNFVTAVEKFDLPLAENPEAISLLSARINLVINRSGIPKNKMIGIGIGMPGFIDVKKGINYTFLKANGKTITEYINEKTGIPVYIDNDSSLIALAELRFGAARKKKNAMVINIGWGVGLGIILNGELYRGHNGFAGEFSHIPLFQNGKLCSCGKSGCLETETSLLVVIEKAKEGLKSGRQSMLKLPSLENLERAHETLITAAYQGDQFTVELFSETGYNIGRGVAVLIHLLNPELIVLSGRGSSVGRIWQAPIQHALNEYCIPRLVSGTTIEISMLGYRAEIIGAAALVMENMGMESKEKLLAEDLQPNYLD